MSYYHNSKNTSRPRIRSSSSQDSTSSDLFDMLLGEAGEDKGQRSTRVVSRSETRVSGKKGRMSYDMAALEYSEQYSSSKDSLLANKRPRLSPPASSPPPSTSTATNTPTLSPTGNKLVVPPPSQPQAASRSEQMKIFDFDDDLNDDSDSQGGVAKVAPPTDTSPSGTSNRKPVRRVKPAAGVRYTNLKAWETAKASKTTREVGSSGKGSSRSPRAKGRDVNSSPKASLGSGKVNSPNLRRTASLKATENRTASTSKGSTNNICSSDEGVKRVARTESLQVVQQSSLKTSSTTKTKMSVTSLSSRTASTSLKSTTTAVVSESRKNMQTRDASSVSTSARRMVQTTLVSGVRQESSTTAMTKSRPQHNLSSTRQAPPLSATSSKTTDVMKFSTTRTSRTNRVSDDNNNDLYAFDPVAMDTESISMDTGSVTVDSRHLRKIATETGSRTTAKSNSVHVKKALKFDSKDASKSSAVSDQKLKIGSRVSPATSSLNSRLSAEGSNSTQTKTDAGNRKRKNTVEPDSSTKPHPEGVANSDDMLREIDSLLGEGEYAVRGVGGASDDPFEMALSDGLDERPQKLRKSSSDVSRMFSYTPFDRPSTSPVDSMPSLTKSSSWPRRGLTSASEEVESKPAVRGVREAHQAMEVGENCQFFEEAHYMLDNIKPSQPLHVRCLGMCNLATHYLDPEFSRQLRSHSFTSKVTLLLRDALQYPALCLATAVLFYVITRNKLNNEWDKNGTKLLVDLLDEPDSSGKELTGKAARDMVRIKTKTRTILEKVADRTSQGVDTPPPEDEEEDELPLSQPLQDKQEPEKQAHCYRVLTDEVSVSELSRECIISLTSPLNSPQWLRDELRVQGALDRLANAVMRSCDRLSEVDCSSLDPECCDSITRCARVLERELKCIENLALMNQNNQSYLIIFDGSVLLTKLVQFLKTGHRLLSYSVLSYSVQLSLLAVMKVLLNLTHNSDLGSSRVGEQREVIANIFRILLHLPDTVASRDTYDFSLLALSLLVNLTEHSTKNCKLLESFDVDSVARQPASSSQRSHDQSYDDHVMSLQRQKSSIRLLVSLFLEHHKRADSTDIEMPTLQRLSQISGSQPSSRPSTSSTGGFPSPLKASDRPGAERERVGVASTSSKVNLSDRISKKISPSTRLTEGPSSASSLALTGESSRSVGVVSSDGEEEYEEIEMDPLVYDREEFNSALDQAGRQMEDCILSSHAALLLGILAKHNHDNVDFIKNLMPSKSFSEMLGVLKEFVSFMNYAGTVTGLDSIRHTMKFLEAVQ